MTSLLLWKGTVSIVAGELAAEHQGFVELLVVVAVGPLRDGEDVHQPPDADAIAGQDLDDAQRDVVQEEALPAEQDGDEQHDSRFLQVHGHQDAKLGVVQLADLVLHINHRRRVEALAVAHDEGLD